MAKRTALNARKTFIDNFQLIKGVTAFKRPASPPRLLHLLMVFIPAGLIACCLFLFIRNQFNRTV
jgi:hypothetical protein